MSETKMPETKKDQLSRRGFLGATALAGALSGIAMFGGKNSVLGPREAEAKTYEKIDDVVEIDMDIFERYDVKRTAFQHSKAYSSPVPGAYEPHPDDDPLFVEVKSGKNVEAFVKGDPGYTAVDYAAYYGGQATWMTTGAFMTGQGNAWDSVPSRIMEDGSIVPIGTLYGQSSKNFPAAPGGKFMDVAEKQYEFESPEQASYAVKKACKMFGADLAGVTDYDERWIYSEEPYFPTDLDGKPIKEAVDLHRPIDMGFTPKSVIVHGHEMDYESMKAIGMVSESAVMVAYSQMAEVGLRIAKFLRQMGYNSYHAGNNASSNVPETIRAGLGESCRMGIAVSKEFGPRFRTGTVYTDLVLAPDPIKTFGVKEFCEVCQVCTDACPSGAISDKSFYDPENKPANISTQAGVQKYCVDAQKCYYQWAVMGNGCGICISVCPYNKPQTWNHDLVKVVTLIPGLNSMARYFDHFFGFGQIATAEELTEFWHRAI